MVRIFSYQIFYEIRLRFIGFRFALTRHYWYFYSFFADYTVFVAYLIFLYQRVEAARSLVLALSTTMLLIGFYFTPSLIGRCTIAALIAVKYWFFLFWIKTEGESEDLIEND